ncbi:hypothetical protein PPTG_08709 [Phytophthora nicotianae INRA-310]|uniref:Uncharacterized protein n=2 Tax=Phytophthora nicotianae TaxID=4792 RepID=W2QHE4_PHYN3|nr:hypothetical protein PPTG_08709 [Phytophthora nicotianae INRA-310]ETM52087.1 hypothetical protein L914_04205 [Phytophthora nicotianae]ETN12608.1 hypothetical protein PPTG_08709 [Phytophthora nicotianae INRA-310]
MPCAWRMKLLVCQETSSVDIYELREFIKELARENLTPVRIRNALGRKFGMRPSALSSLRTVQNIVHHYRRTQLGGTATRKKILEAV